MALGEMEGRAELHVERLHGMLQRHCPAPFRLVCYSDRPRRLLPSIEQRDCGAWPGLSRPGMRVTTRKLGLFSPQHVDFESFVYLDLSLVIRRSLGALLAQAFGSEKALVVVDDWHHPGVNSSVMRIRRGALAVVHEAFVAGERYAQKVPGDQDFLNAILASRGLQGQVETFAPALVASYKQALRIGRREPERARALIEAATIVKFHGRPRMHQAFDPTYHFLRIRLRELLHGRLHPVLPTEALKREWLGEARGARV